ncbi:MAG: TonB-dependent receptor [Sphingomonas sp.]|nr:MAG: TonB-dependent receptor [Sphingomonas sp.]
MCPALGVLACLGTPALSAPDVRGQRVDVPAGELSDRMALLARQAGISISVSSASLWRAQVRGVRGTLPPGEALTRMLDGTSGRAVQLSPTSWRIEPQRRAAKQLARRPIEKAVPLPAEQPQEDPPILVTAGKLDQPKVDFPGTVHLFKGSDLSFGGERGTDSILSRLASTSSTHLGSGRNKLFIRGMADSSFTGPTQSTVGQYLGDLRLNYNSPDPDLRLHDIERVEVLEGSQGTLYGAGSMAGIIRVVPNAPDPSALSLSAGAGLSLTQHGQPGGDMSATANLPLGRGHALRLTGYGISEGGYIDNPLRGKSDINRSRLGGGRAALLLDAGAGWQVELGGIYQATAISDAQYADRDGPPLSRSSPVVEDSNASYAMATMVVRKQWGQLTFQASNALVQQRVSERFNASAADMPPQLFRQRNNIRMLVNETRLWRPVTDGFGWVLGISAIDNNSRQTRSFEQGFAEVSTTGASNSIREYTAYAKASVKPLDWLVLGGGGRVTHSRLKGGAEDVALVVKLAGAPITAGRRGTEWLPSAEALAHVTDNLSLFARYEESFRPGGLAIESDFVRRFRRDHVNSWETGARWKAPAAGLSASLSVTHSFWRDIQADFIDGSGFPTTANIGNGRITSITGNLAWKPSDSLTIELGAVYNDSRVIALSPEVARFALSVPSGLPVSGTPDAVTAPGLPGQFGPQSNLGRIPNVADHALQGSADYLLHLGDQDLRFSGWMKYLGPSRLGIGPTLGDVQGDYLDTGLAARVGTNWRGVSLTVTNLLDSRGNRFALGTPFETSAGRFLTPQRPRTLRLAIDSRF